MKSLAGPLRIEFAQYKELSVFSQFGTDLDQDTLERLAHGERIMEVLKQGQYKPLSVENQVLIFYALSKRHLIDVETNRIRKFQNDLIKYVDKRAPEIKKEIGATGKVSESLEEQLDAIIAQVKEEYNYS